MKSATRRVVFFPYRHGGRQGVLRVVGLRFDGNIVQPDLDGDGVVIDADAVSEVLIDIEYVLPVLDSLVPADEAAAPIVRVVLVATEAASWLRQATRMEVLDGIARVTMAVRTVDVDEQVSLQAQVVRGTQRTGGRAVASDRGARLVESHPLLLRFRERAPRTGSFMSVRWQSFESEAAFRAWVGLPWYLQLTADPPVLWLNSDLTEVGQLLAGRARSGRPAALRDLLFRTIAATAWNQLFDDAVRGLAWDEEGVVRYGRSWHEHVLRHVARHAYGGRPRSERLHYLLARAREASEGEDAHGASLLAEDASRGVASWMDLGRQIDKAAGGLR